MIYRVTKYAQRNRLLLNEKAFSDCNHKVPSGFDVCLQKYGGPFSSSIVEDVKSFFSIVKILILASSFFYFVHISYNMNDIFQKHLMGNTEDSDITLNYTSSMNHMAKGLAKIPIVIMLPAYIIVVRPLILPRLPKSLKKIGIYYIVTLIPYLVVIAVDLALQTQYKHTHCMFKKTHNYTDIPPAFGKYFQAYNLVNHAVSDVIVTAIYAALYKFICSQSPHSMKGFLVGTIFALTGFYELAVNLIAVMIGHMWKLNIRHINCSTMYYIINFTLGVATMLLYARAAHNYRYRRVGGAEDEDLEPAPGGCGGGLPSKQGGRWCVRRNVE